MSEQILMSELVNRQNAINKPGTACLGCRRRKLKCNREPEGCLNCNKSSLQCVYPAPEVGVKRKRGPYKKDKTPRERHLEDLVKYLKPEASKSGHDTGSSDQGSPYDDATPGPGLSRSISAPSTAQAANSESLVTDALIALTRSSVADQDARADSGSSFLHKYVSSGVHGTAASQHPPARRIFEYWHLFQSRVDPMVKVVHCPTFAKKLFGVIDNIGNIAPSTNALLFGIYYTALSSCTARETRQRFGESQEELMQRYGRYFESAIGHSFDCPSLEALQALVLYMIPNQRHGGSIKHLFQLAVRSAQTLRLQEEPEPGFSPLEAELRRRVWYHLCGLESRSAEESTSRKSSVLHNHTVRMPSNLNDYDIAPGMTKGPGERNGITEMTFPILRFEIHSLIFGLIQIKKKWAGFDQVAGRLQEEQNEWLASTRRRLEHDYMRHLDTSRPYDWLCSQFMEGMLIKARLMVDFPSGTVPSKTMSMRERMYLLQASVDIIQMTHVLAVDERISDWLWYFRGYVQWHCLAVVVAELGWNSNQSFSNSAWAVLDPMLSDWDVVYKSKKDEPAWDHVNAIIERARSLRLRNRPHAMTKNTLSKARSTPSMDMVADRTASTESPAMTAFPIRSTMVHTPDQQIYAPPATQPQFYQAEATVFQQQAPQHFHRSSSSQFSSTGAPEVDPYAGTLATGFNFDIGNGFDDIDFAAFNEVFNSQSWNQFDPMDTYSTQLYDSAPYAAGYTIAPSR